MKKRNITVLIMAAGTGGHVFPALAIAQQLKDNGVNVAWLGTPKGMENNLVASADIPLHHISVKGLRGAGIFRWFQSPFMLLIAFVQSFNVIRVVKPDCILGMGGFICGPAGIAAKMLGAPLLIHEQNAVPGLTNKCLAKISVKVFESFPNTFAKNVAAVFTGNPIRKEILEISSIERKEPDNAEFRVLVLGGSQGAIAINKVLPEVAAKWANKSRLKIRHQTGSVNLKGTIQLYESLGQVLGWNIEAESFIKDMASAYQWADIVICRSGASTVSELAAVGLPSILVPYPFHKDEQQLLNAQWLESNGAASIILQSDFTPKNVLSILSKLSANRPRLKEIGNKAKALASLEAHKVISCYCMEVANA